MGVACAGGKSVTPSLAFGLPLCPAAPQPQTGALDASINQRPAMTRSSTPTPPSTLAQTAAAADKLRPPKMVCNLCGAALAQVNALDTAHLPGIHAAFGAHCGACKQDTWAVRGEVAAVKAFYAALEKSSGSTVQLGTARPAASS